jgi:negative regulator of flagellin synthesis FlgM
MRVTVKRDVREITPINGVTPIRGDDANRERQKQRETPHAESGPGGSSASRGKPRPEAAFDPQRVAKLRAALAEGRIEFDAAKLASLIQRYHGSKK